MKPNLTAGIDFGNQTSILSIPTEHGIDIILNESSNRKTPTIVGYQENRRTSGEFAQQQQMMNINNTITQLKRLVGLLFDSEEREQLSSEVPFEIVRLANGHSGVKIENGQIILIEQIIGHYLKSLVEIIQKRNPEVSQIVLTIPSNLTEIQRKAILNAASISKVKIAELIDNPTAAAISYVKIHNDRFSDDKKLNVLFIEFGDTSMSSSVASMTSKSIEMKSKVSDKSISGSVFGQILESYLIEKVTERYKINPRENKRSLIRFKQACEKVKKTLSSNPVVLFEVPSLMNDIDVSIPIKRDEFINLTKSYMPKIKEVIEASIEKAGISKEDISFVELIGGTSRIPSIKSEIKEIVGKEAKMSLDLDECQAIGAGYMASKIDGNDIGIDFINKNNCPYSINAKLGSESKTFNIFNENSKLPSSSKFSIPINQQKETLTIYCNQEEIGKLEIHNGSENQTEVEINCSVDSFGIFNIDDVVNKNNENQKVEFSYISPMTLSEEEITKYKKIEEEQSENDKLEIEIDNTKNNLESLIFSTENTIKGLKSNAVISSSQKKLESIHNWFEENEFERLSLNEYKSKIIEINKIMKDISKYQDNQKKYEAKLTKINELKQMLQKSHEKVTKDNERKQMQESIYLQNEIPKMISKIDKLLNSSKNYIINVDINDIEKEIKEIVDKANSLSQIPIPKKKCIKRKRRTNNKRNYGQFDDEWSPFGMRNSIFDDFMGNRWQPRRYQQPQEDEYDYEYENEYESQIHAQKQEEERQRQEFLRKQEEEHKKQEFLRKQEEERKKQEFLRKQEEERKKQEFLRKQEEERKRQEYLKKQEEERLKQEFIRKQEEERKRQEFMRKQEEERQKREEEQKKKIENEKRRRAQIEQERNRRRKVNNYTNGDDDDFSYLKQMKKESQIESEERKQEQLQRKQIELENRKRAELEQERIKRAKEAEIQRRQQMMNDPWSTSMFNPFGRSFNPQRQSVQPRQYQQQRRMMPGYRNPWGF